MLQRQDDRDHSPVSTLYKWDSRGAIYCEECEEPVEKCQCEFRLAGRTPDAFCQECLGDIYYGINEDSRMVKAATRTCDEVWEIVCTKCANKAAAEAWR